MTDAPRIGHVLRYPYLWARQALSGETEGRKTRPCAVVLAITNQVGNTELRLCAITTQPPSSSNRAISVPEIERRRAGLDTGIGLWVILDEHNVDVFEHSFYIEPQSHIGVFSPAFTKALQQGMIAVLKERIGKTVKRSDI
jgi:hypothetical protein